MDHVQLGHFTYDGVVADVEEDILSYWPEIEVYAAEYDYGPDSTQEALDNDEIFTEIPSRDGDIIIYANGYTFRLNHRLGQVTVYRSR